MHVADIIRSLRARGLTQVEISRRTGIPQPRLSRWESGNAPAGADDALRLNALRLEIGADDPPPVPAEALDRVLRMAEQLEALPALLAAAGVAKGKRR